MTDKTKYSNISVSKETYSSLQKLSKEIFQDAIFIYFKNSHLFSELQN